MSDPSEAQRRVLESLKLRVHRDGQRLGHAVENCGDVLPDALRDALLARTPGPLRTSAFLHPVHAMRG